MICQFYKMKELQMSIDNCYKWKKGQLALTSKLLDIAKYFDVSIDFLVGYTK